MGLDLDWQPQGIRPSISRMKACLTINACRLAVTGNTSGPSLFRLRFTSAFVRLRRDKSARQAASAPRPVASRFNMTTAAAIPFLHKPTIAPLTLADGLRRNFRGFLIQEKSDGRHEFLSHGGNIFNAEKMSSGERVINDLIVICNGTHIVKTVACQRLDEAVLAVGCVLKLVEHPIGVSTAIMNGDARVG